MKDFDAEKVWAAVFAAAFVAAANRTADHRNTTPAGALDDENVLSGNTEAAAGRAVAELSRWRTQR